MRRCGGSPPTAKLPHFSEEVPAGNKSPNKKSRWRQLSTSSARNSRPWHALQNPEPTGKGKGKGNPTKTTANHPNPELPRTQKLEPRRLSKEHLFHSFERSQRVTGLCGQSLFKLPLENTVLEVPRKARLQSTVLHTHPTASGHP